jgi:hypothetical protein
MNAINSSYSSYLQFENHNLIQAKQYTAVQLLTMQQTNSHPVPTPSIHEISNVPPNAMVVSQEFPQLTPSQA